MLKSPDIIALTETWLNDDNKTYWFIEGYKSFHTVREPKKHGGVSLLVRDGLTCEKIEEFSYLNSLIEICSINLNINNTFYTIAAIYRPGNKTEKVKEFRREIVPILKSPHFKKSNSILLGDFNIDLLIHSEHQDTNEYLNLLQTFSYTPLITRATRFPQGQQLGNPSLLDHIFINFTPPSLAGILHYEITDHLPVFLNFNLPLPVTNTFPIKFRIFDEVNQDEFVRNIALVMWEEILMEPDVNSNFDNFFTIFERNYINCFPLKTKMISSRRIDKPWLSNGLITSIKKKIKCLKTLNSVFQRNAITNFTKIN